MYIYVINMLCYCWVYKIEKWFLVLGIILNGLDQIDSFRPSYLISSNLTFSLEMHKMVSDKKKKIKKMHKMAYLIFQFEFYGFKNVVCLEK